MMKIRNSKFEIRNSRLGFTLIELMVVVTIIALLTAVGVMSYQAATRKARDGRRQTDLEQVRTSLELYRSDVVANTYPLTLAEMVPNYIKSIPVDPKGFAYYYLRAVDGRTYSVCAHMEAAGSQVDQYCGTSNRCGGSCNYEATNP